MAAYGALCSLMHIIQKLQHHPYPPIFLDKEQVESLTENVIFLQKFLEGYSQLVGYSDEADPLETRIADAVYAAEDLIESHIVDQIHGEEISCNDLYQGLHEVIEDMDSIKKEVTKMEKKIGVQDLMLHKNSSISVGSLRSHSRAQKSKMDFDDVLYEALEKLVKGQPNRQIIPIVGMGGIGKTTLARNIYEKKVVVEHFDVRVWITISQVYSMREIILKVLEEIEGYESQTNEQLGEKIHKHLWGRRYLIIMDDIWDIEVWNHLKFFFPDNHNGSRIMITTRLSILVVELCNSPEIKLELLDEDDIWALFCKTVFEECKCPLELEEVGKQISRSCKGLPLSIVVIGGLLAKSEQTQQYWEYIAKNLNSIVNLEENERCIQLLYLSYRNLPVYLKLCFLYMGVFKEDSEIRASKLIKLWVAEGFLKPIDGKSLEEVAEEYLEELIGRNLIMVERRNFLKKVKRCKIHDLLRDLCLREARKQKFVCVVEDHSLNIPQDLSRERRICIHQHPYREEYPPQFLDAFESASCARSLIWEYDGHFHLPLASSRLLRVSSVFDGNYTDNADLEAILPQVNLRYLFVAVYLRYEATSRLSIFPSSVPLLWNLQTLIVFNTSTLSPPSEIWKMPQLRHLMFDEVVLPDPPSDLADIVLENLQTLSDIHDFKCSEEMVKRIPNINKLNITYEEEQMESLHLLNNLSHLKKLKSLRLRVCQLSDPENLRNHLMQNIIFPLTLKKLTLHFTHLHGEDLTTKIGLLPLLEVLKLRRDALIGPEWKTSEGQFCSLKVLLIHNCDLECWTTDNSHFPCLKLLSLRFLEKLTDIPSSIGDIPTLELIKLEGCSNSAVDSAKRIQEVQEELGNEDLQVEYIKICYRWSDSFSAGWDDPCYDSSDFF